MSAPTNPQPIHIFKAGRHVAMSGQSMEFTESDLRASVAAYDPAKHEAPIVIGHPQVDGPAYGWVKSLRMDGAGMFADPGQVDPQFAGLVQGGYYKKVSAAFYEPDSPSNPVPGVYYLRHVGFLGAQPPGVKGLRQVQFSDSDKGVVEFGDYSLSVQSGLWRRLREFLLTKFGQETADSVVPDWQVDELRDQANADMDDPAAITASPLFSEPAAGSQAPQQTTSEPSMPDKDLAALEAENAQLKARIEQQDAATAAKAKADAHAANMMFCESVVAKGCLAPKDKDLACAFLDFAGADQTVCFGEGDGKQPLAAAFKTFLGGLPQVIPLDEIATAQAAGQVTGVQFAEGVDPVRAAQDGQIRKYMAEHQCDYATAAHQVIK